MMDQLSLALLLSGPTCTAQTGLTPATPIDPTVRFGLRNSLSPGFFIQIPFQLH